MKGTVTLEAPCVLRVSRKGIALVVESASVIPRIGVTSVGSERLPGMRVLTYILVALIIVVAVFHWLRYQNVRLYM